MRRQEAVLEVRLEEEPGRGNLLYGQRWQVGKGMGEGERRFDRKTWFLFLTVVAVIYIRSLLLLPVAAAGTRGEGGRGLQDGAQGVK